MENQSLLTKLGQWHQKIDAFFDGSFQRNKSNMACADGCDKCCKVERSVFSIEAELIREHVKDNPILESSENEPGQCAFLTNGRCSVYAVRPSICRSHGLVLQQDDGISHCELNFLKGLPPKQDWLGGQMADTVLSTMQIAHEKNGGRAERISLRELWRELTTSAN